jgi:hypothetical protein
MEGQMAARAFALAQFLAIVFCAIALFAESVNANTIGFSCKRTGVNNPRTYYYVLDLSNSTLSLAQSVDMAAYTAPAKITPSSVDWQASPSLKGHLDRQTGMLTLFFQIGSYEMSFACEKTGGI